MSARSLSAAEAPLWTLGAAELAARIARRELSAAQVVEAHIARIEAANPPLNAVVVRRYDEARAEARAADGRLTSGAPVGPLHGVPVVIKECIDVAGTPSTSGLPSRASTRATADEKHVARLRAAGAIVLAKTNVAQLLAFLESDNPLYGRTQNPWDLTRAPGGSSGGQAAIIAAGGAPLGLGTDIGGSNRVPAAFCGIVGFKGTQGRLPDEGRLSFPPAERTIESQIGIFARSVEDVALGLEVANGGSAAAAADPRMTLGDWRAVDLSKLHVGVFDFDGTFPACPAARRAVAEAADSLRARGVRVSEWKLPDPGEVEAAFFGLLGADGGATFKQLLGRDRRDTRIALLLVGMSMSGRLRPLFRAITRLSGRGKLAEILGVYIDHRTASYFDLVDRTLAYRERFRRALDDAAGGPLDAILSPAAALPALRHGASAEVTVMGLYSCLWNVLGYPALAVPATRVRAGEESDRAPSKDRMDSTAFATERGSAGLPIAVQVAARPWQDHVALALGAAIEREAREHAAHPSLAALLARR